MYFIIILLYMRERQRDDDEAKLLTVFIKSNAEQFSS